MSMNRRSVLAGFGAAGAALAASGSTVAQEKYPSGPIKIIVPYPAGGPYDGIPRVIGDYLSRTRGWSVVVENRPGASGVVGIMSAKKAPADGHTLVITTASTHGSGPIMSTKLLYDPVKDLEQIVLLGDAPLALLVRPEISARTVEELLALIRKNVGKYNYGSGGFASQHHLAMSMMLFRADLPQSAAVHIPFLGLAPALHALVAGQVQFMFTSTGAAMPFIENGSLRAIAVSSLKRAERLPDVPTLAESGFPGFHIVPWCGLAAPAGTPAAILDALNEAVNTALDDPDVRKRISNLDYIVRGGSRAEFEQWIAKEMEQYTKLVAAAGLRPK